MNQQQPMDGDTPDFQDFIVPQKARALRLRGPGPEGDFNTHWFEERLERGAFGKPLKIEQDDFMRRYPHFKNNHAEDAEWGPVRILGQGGFGIVGLWEKRDANNLPEDQIVIKQQDAKETAEHYELNHKYYPHLLQEAVIHRDMNRKEPGSFPKLRAYKYLKNIKKKLAQGQPNFPSVFRMYLEHCPHGDLEHLRKLYSIWDQPIPELFLWHLLLRLAVAGDTLREPPDEDSEWVIVHRKLMRDEKAAESNKKDDSPKPPPRKIPRGKGRNRVKETRAAVEEEQQEEPDESTKPFEFQNYFCLHLDMKPHNVLLGDNKRADTPDIDRRSIDNPDYPLAKLSDFGIARYTTWDHEENPKSFFDSGTVGYKAPEQEGYGANFPIPPTGVIARDTRIFHPPGQVPRSVVQGHADAYNQQQFENRTSPRDIVFDHSMNIYGIGRTVYSLMSISLRDPKELPQGEAGTLAEYNLYKDNRYHQLRKIRNYVEGFYTPRLRRLVWRCLDPNPSNRPSQLELLDQVQRGLRLYKRKLLRLAASGKALPETKLYYRGHEINDMPLGDAKRKPLLADVRRVLRDEFLNPDLPRLRVPVQKYAHLNPEVLTKEIENPKQPWRKVYTNQPDMSRWFTDPDTDDEDGDEAEDGDTGAEESNGEE